MRSRLFFTYQPNGNLERTKFLDDNVYQGQIAAVEYFLQMAEPLNVDNWLPSDTVLVKLEPPGKPSGTFSMSYDADSRCWRMVSNGYETDVDISDNAELKISFEMRRYSELQPGKLLFSATTGERYIITIFPTPGYTPLGITTDISEQVISELNSVKSDIIDLEGSKVDKYQGAGHAGELLGIGSDGLVLPVFDNAAGAYEKANEAATSALEAQKSATEAATSSTESAQKAEEATETADDARERVQLLEEQIVDRTGGTAIYVDGEASARQDITADLQEQFDELRKPKQGVVNAETEKGSFRTVKDATKGQVLEGISIYGKSTQDGIPTPGSPVPIKSVTSPITFTHTGKNLFTTANFESIILYPKPQYQNIIDVNTFSSSRSLSSDYESHGFAFNVISGTDYTFSFNVAREILDTENAQAQGLSFYFYDITNGKKTNYQDTFAIYNFSYSEDTKKFTFNIPGGCHRIGITVNQSTNAKSGTNYNNLIRYTYSNLQLETGARATAFEPYQSETVTYALPDGTELRSLPTYGDTDEIYDEVTPDGRLIQRVRHHIALSTSWGYDKTLIDNKYYTAFYSDYGNSFSTNSGVLDAYCNLFPVTRDYYDAKANMKLYILKRNGHTQTHLYISTTFLEEKSLPNDVTGLRAWMATLGTLELQYEWAPNSQPAPIQLEPTPEFELYEGTNHIWSDFADFDSMVFRQAKIGMPVVDVVYDEDGNPQTVNPFNTFATTIDEISGKDLQEKAREWDSKSGGIWEELAADILVYDYGCVATFAEPIKYPCTLRVTSEQCAAAYSASIGTFRQVFDLISVPSGQTYTFSQPFPIYPDYSYMRFEPEGKFIVAQYAYPGVVDYKPKILKVEKLKEV